MQKVYSLLIGFLSLTFVPKAEASHLVGGEISWQCLSNGKYVFKMVLNRDCSQLNWFYKNEQLDIYGAPLPLDSSNQTISSIQLMPDSNKWLATNRGDHTPKCGFNDTTNNSLSCSNSDRGAVQTFYYISDTIMLKGVPPVNGWDFVYEPSCCRTFVDNITTRGQPIFRSTMYPTATNQAVNFCFDSSPVFAQKPWVSFCRGDRASISLGTIDDDLDSVIYSLAPTYNLSGGSFVQVNYDTGYSFLNPTPDTSFHPNNEPSRINPITARLSFQVNNGSGLQSYYVVVRADTYRNGVRIASVYKEQVIYIMDCTMQNSNTNNSPQVSMWQNQQSDTVIRIKAGNRLTMPININDTDSTAGALQSLKLTFSSNQFSDDFSDSIACSNPPCAVLKNQPLVFNSTFNEFVLIGTGTLATTFEWQTSCNHLLDSVGIQEYNFYYRVQDDNCIIPSQHDGKIKVIVEPLAMLGIQQHNNYLLSLDTSQSYQWYNCDSNAIVSGETDSVFTPSQNGNYAVILQNNNCIDTSDCIAYTTVGLNENHFQNSINFYPNPTEGSVTIKTGAIQESLQIKIRNIHGQLVQEEQFVNQSNLQLQLNGKSGIYFIELVSGNGERANVKVVKR